MEEKVYDYVILGSGIGGLSIAALLANRGKSVCVVEACKEIGGYARTFTKGKYSFCQAIVYLCGCMEGWPIYKFLKEIGLSSKIKHNSFDKESFDIINIKGIKVGIPIGIERFKKKIEKMFPEHSRQINKYFKIVNAISNEGRKSERICDKYYVFRNPLKYKYLLKYLKYSLNDIFEELNFPQELRGILAGQIAICSASPKEVSFPFFAGGEQFSYCKGAHFPKKGMAFFVDEISKKITANSENKIFTSCSVHKIYHNKKKIISIKSNKGKIFGKNFISNIDPQRTLQMMDPVYSENNFAHKLRYKYSTSVFVIYLGLKNINLKKYGFGRWNIMHHPSFDINEEFENQIKHNNFSNPWMAISTPSLYSDEGIMCPKNHHTMMIMTVANYNHFRSLYDSGRANYYRFKRQITERILDIIDKHYIPNIKKHIDVKIVHSPLDFERIFQSPEGNSFGRVLAPDSFTFKNKITSKTPFKNLFFVGATSSYPGIIGVIVGGLDLFRKLRKDF